MDYNYLMSYLPEDYLFGEYWTDAPALLILVIPITICKGLYDKSYLNSSILDESQINTGIKAKLSIYK